MGQNSNSQINWNEYAINYDSLLKLKPYTSMLDEVVRVIIEKNIESVLDAGCGTGNLISKLVELDILHLVAIDSSPEMLNRAKEKCLDPEAEFVLTGLDEALPFPPRFFEAVACINALYALERPEATLAEFARVLEPGGTLVIVTPKQGYENGLILKAHCGSTKPDGYWRDMHSDPVREDKLLREALHDQETYSQMRKVLEVNRRISQNARFHFFTEAELRNLVLNARFEIVDYRETYAQQSHLLVARRS